MAVFGELFFFQFETSKLNLDQQVKFGSKIIKYRLCSCFIWCCIAVLGNILLYLWYSVLHDTSRFEKIFAQFPLTFRLY